VTNPTEELAEALRYVDSSDVFAAAIGGYPCEIVEGAIALQDSQPERLRLTKLYEGYLQVLEEESLFKSSVALLTEAIKHGAETIRTLFNRWSSEQRWSAVSGIAQGQPELMSQFVATTPDWPLLCG
jgi:hypothetical protein